MTEITKVKNENTADIASNAITNFFAEFIAICIESAIVGTVEYALDGNKDEK